MAENDDESSIQSDKPSPPSSPRKSEKFFGMCNGDAGEGSDAESTSSESSSSSSNITLPPPPDGGWGWAVVASSFVIHFIADGYAFSFGVLYTELLDYFQESRGKTAWIGSLFVAVPLLTGPIASALTNRYGCRIITIVGSIISATGLVLSSFSNSTEMLCLTFGVIAGFGLSMVYVPAVVVVAFYFEKKRAFATGIAVAGSGLGNCVFAPLTELLIEKYTWRGAIFILGGIMLNITACGAIFRPLVPPSVEKRRCQRMHSERSFPSHASSTHHSAADVRVATSLEGTAAGLDQELVVQSMLQFPTYANRKASYITPDLLKDLKENGKSIHEYLAENNLLEKFYAVHSMSDCTNSQPNVCVNSDLSVAWRRSLEEGNDGNAICNYENSPVQSPESENVEGNVDSGENVPSPTELMAANGSALEHIEMKPTANIPDAKKPKKKIHTPRPAHHHARTQHHNNPHQIWLNGARPKFKRTEVQGLYVQPLTRKDIFYRGNLQRPGAFFSGRAASCPDIFISKPVSDDEEDECFSKLKVFSLLRMSREVKHFIRTMLDLSIFKNVIFIYFCLSNMLLYMSYDVPYVYAVDVAVQELGVSDKKASLLLSLIGLMSTFGQISIGYIGDQDGVDTLHMYNALTSSAGLFTMLVPLINSYGWLAGYCVIYGLLISANYSLTTIILVELLSMDKLTNAYGIVMLAEGIANVVGPPLAGWMSDHTGSYDVTFVFFGAIMLLSGSMLFAIPCLRRYQRQIDQNMDSCNISISAEESKDIAVV